MVSLAAWDKYLLRRIARSYLASLLFLAAFRRRRGDGSEGRFEKKFFSIY